MHKHNENLRLTLLLTTYILALQRIFGYFGAVSALANDVDAIGKCNIGLEFIDGDFVSYFPFVFGYWLDANVALHLIRCADKLDSETLGALTLMCSTPEYTANEQAAQELLRTLFFTRRLRDISEDPITLARLGAIMLGDKHVSQATFWVHGQLLRETIAQASKTDIDTMVHILRKPLVVTPFRKKQPVEDMLAGLCFFSALLADVGAISQNESICQFSTMPFYHLWLRKIRSGVTTLETRKGPLPSVWQEVLSTLSSVSREVLVEPEWLQRMDHYEVMRKRILSFQKSLQQWDRDIAGTARAAIVLAAIEQSQSDGLDMEAFRKVLSRMGYEDMSGIADFILRMERDEFVRMAISRFLLWEHGLPSLLYALALEAKKTPSLRSKESAERAALSLLKLASVERPIVTETYSSLESFNEAIDEFFNACPSLETRELMQQRAQLIARYLDLVHSMKKHIIHTTLLLTDSLDDFSQLPSVAEAVVQYTRNEQLSNKPCAIDFNDIAHI